MNKLLYIGLNGLAGSGKDTVAKMLKTILSKEWESLEVCKEYYFSRYTNPTQSATFPPNADDKNSNYYRIHLSGDINNNKTNLKLKEIR